MTKHHLRKDKNINRIAATSIGTEVPSEQIQQQADILHDDFVPDFGDVQKLAYQLYVQKGGGDLENWLEAEKTLKQEHPKIEAKAHN